MTAPPEVDRRRQLADEGRLLTWFAEQTPEVTEVLRPRGEPIAMPLWTEGSGLNTRAQTRASSSSDITLAHAAIVSLVSALR